MMPSWHAQGSRVLRFICSARTDTSDCAAVSCRRRRSRATWVHICCDERAPGGRDRKRPSRRFGSGESRVAVVGSTCLLRRAFAVSALVLAAAVANADVTIIPRPTTLAVRKGRPVVLSSGSVIVADPDAVAEATWLQGVLAPPMGGTPGSVTAHGLGKIR